MSTIGFIGLGTMGAPMAGRLLAAGHEVYGTNRTAAKAAGLVERGLRWRDTPREVAAAADVVFTMVADDAALAAVAEGPDGVLAGLAEGARDAAAGTWSLTVDAPGPATDAPGPVAGARGKIWVDMSTVSPRTSRDLAFRVRTAGADLLDAPVSGSVSAAVEGSLAIMVGGRDASLRRVEPLLRELGRSVDHVGTNGHGLLLKLAVNVSLAAQTLAFAEGLLLAERGGIDPKLAARVMTASAVGSPAVKVRAPLMLDLPEHAWFDIRLMRKDIRLAREAARDLGAPLPSAATADEQLTEADELGYGHRDIAALYAALAHAAD